MDRLIKHSTCFFLPRLVDQPLADRQVALLTRDEKGRAAVVVRAVDVGHSAVAPEPTAHLEVAFKIHVHASWKQAADEAE